jgi:hypothetical protein
MIKRLSPDFADPRIAGFAAGGFAPLSDFYRYDRLCCGIIPDGRNWSLILRASDP